MTKKTKKEVQIVLKETIQNVGKAGSLSIVKSGYARNYLIPNQLGELATVKAIKAVKLKQREFEAKENQFIENCQKIKKSLEQTGEFIIQKRTSDDNKIFGKISVRQVVELLENQLQVDLNRASVEMPEIKELGTFPITVTLHPTVKANITLEILPK